MEMEKLIIPCNLIPRLEYAGIQPLDFDTPAAPADAEFYLRLHIDPLIVTINGKSTRLHAGDISCLPAGSDVRFSGESPGRHWGFRFSWGKVDSAAEVWELPTIIVMGGLQQSIIHECTHIAAGFNALTRDILERERKCKIASARLLTLLLELAQQSKRETQKSEKVLQQIITLLEGNLKEKLMMNQIASRVGVTQTYLSTIFKRRFGITISQYIQQRRISQAKELLTRTMLPINTIGQEIGMSDPQYFNKQFRRAVGISPSRYREKLYL
jgi:AraC-like DNA-binding protein